MRPATNSESVGVKELCGSNILASFEKDRINLAGDFTVYFAGQPIRIVSQEASTEKVFKSLSGALVDDNVYKYKALRFIEIVDGSFSISLKPVDS